MQPTPEKDPTDPIMLGGLGRPKSLRAGTADCSKCELIQFLPPPKGRLLKSFEERFQGAAFGWQNLKPTMGDRLIRNAKRLIATDEMSGMVCVQHILGAIVAEINTHIAQPLSPAPLYSGNQINPNTLASQSACLRPWRRQWKPCCRLLKHGLMPSAKCIR